MAKQVKTQPLGSFIARHRARGAQVWICLGKLLRMFVYQNDWKVLPMAALIAGLVGMVIRKKFCLSMEGTLMGAFALVCVCIWNGAFNSIQVVCRERDVIKREHRSGMYVSSYVFAHMLYQAMLCLLQTWITLYVTSIVGVQYPKEGLLIGSFYLELFVSMFLITYASDMLSLWVSSLAHSTTAAMTVMPFVLIFQLVFSGGMLTLPEWTEPLTRFTISNPALKVIAAQADTNNRPFVTISDMLDRMRDDEVDVSVSAGQVLDILANGDSALVGRIRSRKIGSTPTVGDLVFTLRALLPEEESASPEERTLAAALAQLESSGSLGIYADVPLVPDVTVGDLIDAAAADPFVQAHRDDAFTASPTVGELAGVVGEDRVRSVLEEKTAQASYRAAYEYTKKNVVLYWLHLAFFCAAFALLSVITLSFIDRDRR